MKKWSILLLIINIGYTSAQIKTVPIVNEKLTVKYDSASNFIGGNVDAYVGQKFYLPKAVGYIKEHGYNDFKKNLKGDVYEPVKYEKRTKYESVAGRYFDVISVRKDTKTFISDVYLELKECESGKIIYFDYKNSDSLFPFIVTGYYEKMKKKYVGNNFLLDVKSSSFVDFDDINTENAYVYGKYVNFKCIDYVIEEGSSWKEYLLFENKNNSQLKLSVRDFERIENFSNAGLSITKKLFEIEQQGVEKKNLYNKKEQDIIEKSMLEAKKLIGKTIYNKMEFVYSIDNDDIDIIEKYIPLIVYAVEYGDEFYPVKLLFEDVEGNKFYKKVTFDEKSYSEYEFKLLFSLSDIRKQYPNINNFTWSLIKKGNVRIGMSEKECELSWGEPNDINTTSGSWGIHEQWVYDDSYLYFENGKLTSIQN